MHRESHALCFMCRRSLSGASRPHLTGNAIGQLSDNPIENRQLVSA